MLAHVLLLGVPRRQEHVVAPEKVVTDDATCDGTVAYLFLAKDGLPLSDVWAEYFAGCEAGSVVTHIHTEADAPPAWKEMGLETHVLHQPVRGKMRFNYKFVEAMLRLWSSGLHERAPNGCVPRWHQLVSDSCAPLRSCREVHDALAKRPGVSMLEAVRCAEGDMECSNRKPAGWPVGDKKEMTFWKGSQWSTLWHTHAQMLVSVAPEQEHIWQKAYVPDEHFVVNNLVLQNASFSPHGLVHVIGYEWLEGAESAHAMSASCAEPLWPSTATNLAAASGGKPLFLRDGGAHRLSNSHGSALLASPERASIKPVTAQDTTPQATPAPTWDGDVAALPPRSPSPMPSQPPASPSPLMPPPAPSPDPPPPSPLCPPPPPSPPEPPAIPPYPIEEPKPTPGPTAKPPPEPSSPPPSATPSFPPPQLPADLIPPPSSPPCTLAADQCGPARDGRPYDDDDEDDDPSAPPFAPGTSPTAPPPAKSIGGLQAAPPSPPSPPAPPVSPPPSAPLPSLPSPNVPGTISDLAPCEYKFFNTKLTFESAEAACQSQGLGLAVIFDAADNAAALASIPTDKSPVSSRVWIGSHDRTIEGAWTWLPSNIPVGYTNWSPGEPNSFQQGQEDCTVMKTWNGEWNDIACGNEFAYICENADQCPKYFPAPPPPSEPASPPLPCRTLGVNQCGPSSDGRPITDDDAAMDTTPPLVYGRLLTTFDEDTDSEHAAVSALVGASPEERSSYEAVLKNAAVLGQAFGRKFSSPSCTDRLIRHQRLLREKEEHNATHAETKPATRQAIALTQARREPTVLRGLQFIHIPKNGGSAVEALGLTRGMRWGAKREWQPQPTWYASGRNVSAKASSTVWHERGSWIDGWNECRAVWHEPRAKLRAHGVDPYVGTKTFAVVRDPVARAVSQFSYMAGMPKKVGGLLQAGATHPTCTSAALNDFLMSTLNDIGAEVAALRLDKLGTLGKKASKHGCHWIPQWVYADGADHLVRYEHLYDDLSKLLGPYGFSPSGVADELKTPTASVGFANSTVTPCSNAVELRASVNQTAREALERVYARDFELVRRQSA